MYYIKSYSNNSEYDAAKTSADFWFPHVGYIEDTEEAKWLNSKKDLYDIYGTLTGGSATATITINNSGYTVSPSGADNEFGLVFSEPVTELSFSNQGKIKTLDKLDIDTSAVTNMAYMFSDCIALTSLDLSSFNTSAVTSMNDMFNYCSSLTSLDLSRFNTSAVTSMSNMFKNCRALTSLDLSNFNTSAVPSYSMSSMFSSCTALTTLTMNNTNQTTFDKIKAQLVNDRVVSRVTIIRDEVNWKYKNGAWVEV